MIPSIHSLLFYPIKSCRGISLDSAELTRTGFRYDRHWMLVDRQGQFLSQRTHPRMALIETEIGDDTLLCRCDGQQLEIPLRCAEDHRIMVRVWNDECSAALVSTSASRWFSDLLDEACDLVFMPDSEIRAVDRRYASDDQSVQFADGFPLLVISLASIQLLADKLGESLGIDRFRPNIVLQDCAAHAEDAWRSITVNDIRIELAKPCSRCVIPSIDQRTAEKHPSLLRTLSDYRRREDGKIYVGQNGLHDQAGFISRGQPVSVEYR